MIRARRAFLAVCFYAPKGEERQNRTRTKTNCTTTFNSARTHLRHKHVVGSVVDHCFQHTSIWNHNVREPESDCILCLQAGTVAAL